MPRWTGTGGDRGHHGDRSDAADNMLLFVPVQRRSKEPLHWRLLEGLTAIAGVLTFVPHRARRWTIGIRMDRCK